MDDIFSYFISPDNDTATQKRIAYQSWFCSELPASEFKNEELIFYDAMRFASVLRVPLNLQVFETYLNFEVRKLLLSGNARVIGTETLNFSDILGLETGLQVTKAVMFRLFETADLTEDLSLLPTALFSFFRTRLNKKTLELFREIHLLTTEKMDSEEAINLARERIYTLNEIYNTDKISDITEITLPDTEMEFLCDTGLPTIDNATFGLHRQELSGVEAPAGAGKTRFTLGAWVYRAVTLYKLNVIYYALEQSETEIRSMLVSRHVLEKFRKLIPDKFITAGKVPKDLQPLVSAAKLDLFSSENYGKFHVVQKDLCLEKLTDVLHNNDRLFGPFDIVVIDHMYIISSTDRRLPQHDIMRLSYRKFKQYVRNSNKGGIAVGQFNRDGITASENDKDIDQTMAAGGIEVYRSTDFNIAITSTPAMRACGKRKFHLPKARSTEQINPFLTLTRLGQCYFEQQAGKEI